MINKKKIILMSKLAIYDKNNGDADSRMSKYFRQDYIYLQNMRTRFYVFLGCVIIIIMYWFNEIAANKVDVLAIDYKAEFTSIVYRLAIVLLIYSIISGLKAATDYRKMMRRKAKYFKMMTQLDRAQAVAEDEEEFEEASDYGAGFTGKGNSD